ncbi:hypothetical protein D3C83_264090 [compost metagenome]
MVLRTRWMRSANVASLSSHFGASAWAIREVPSLAMSEAICTCFESGNMSG